MLKIHVQAIVTNDDGVAQSKNLAASIKDLIDKTNQIYAAGGMQLQFDPNKDYLEVSGTALNRDFPASYVQPDGSVVYPKDPNDNDLNPYADVRIEYARKFSDRAVIFFRNVVKPAISWAYSSSESPFVAFNAELGQPADLAHESGHFFHLGHTFSEVKLTAAEAKGTKAQQAAAMLAHLQDRLLKAVSSGAFTKANALNTFDGDRGSVTDTPPDAGTDPFKVLLGGACSATDHIDINVTFPGDSQATGYSLKPDRGLVMSYFKDCNFDHHFSKGQIDRMHAGLHTGNRRFLLHQAAVLWDNGKAYFFKGDQYVRYDVAGDRADPGYPLPIAGHWLGIPWKDEIDAVVNWNNGKAYFFHGSEYARYDVANDKMDSGYPRPISSAWPGLWPDGVDAGVRWNTDVAYFFRGGEYIRYNVTQDKAEQGYPRPIAPNWKGVWADGIDSVVVWNNGKAYFFKGNLYLRYDIAQDRADDGYPRQIPGFWPGVWGEGIDCAIFWNNGKAYMFKGNQYLAYDWTSDRTDDTYPQPIAGNWGGLPAGMNGGMVWDNGKAYFFQGDHYWRFDIPTNKIDAGYPLPIASNWKGIWASGINAAVRWNNGKAYFFKGDEYIRYDIAADKADAGYPRKIKDGWKGLWADGGISAVLANWNHGKAYFFKGTTYIRYDIKADASDPNYPAPIGGGWTGL